MNTDPVSDILECIAKVRAMGEVPNTIIISPKVLAFRCRELGNAKQRRIAKRKNQRVNRFWKRMFSEIHN